MRKTLTTVGSILMLLVLVATTAGSPAVVARQQKDAQPMAAVTKFDAHYRVPNEAAIPMLLEQEGFSLSGLNTSQRAAAVKTYQDDFNAKNPDTPNPEKLRELLKKEQSSQSIAAKSQERALAGVDRSIKSLVVLMEFNPAEETWTAQQLDADDNCVEAEVTMAGPLHNEIAPPGPRDNNTIWYEDTTPELYEEIYFGEGPNAGVIIEHPGIGTVDLRGKTMVNYYLEMSNGKFAPAGEIYPKWFQAAHSEGWYGEDGCGGSHNVRAQDLVLEAIDAVEGDNADFDWQAFDGNEDGIVDNFTVIHAGAGQEAGGGAQGDFAIWSHASMVGWPDGVVVCEAGSAGCPDREIRVKEYSMDPENIDLGVIAEEFGHAAFGLPDLYTTDIQASISNWAIMESGSWNGILGGMEPAPFPLWFKYLLGWVDIPEVDYDSPATVTKIGQLQRTPKGLAPGLKINLPDKEVVTENPLATGQAWWSNLADGVSYTLTRSIDLTGATAPVFSFNSYWSIEEEWDYGYVQVSVDDGATWAFLDDMGDVFTTANTNGNSLGIGLTGTGEGVLSFDLSAYAGQVVLVRMLYSTDAAVQENGWFADDFAVVDGDTTLWSDDIEAGAGDWAAEGWTLVPLTNVYPRYYLVEWRNNQGFDHGLQYAYSTSYYDEDEWQVDRAPYNVPGMLVYLRDSSYALDYTLLDSEDDPPSLGPKHALSLVDSHFWPYEWDEYQYTSGAFLRVNSRVQPGNASFSIQDTIPFTLNLGADPYTGEYQDEPVQTKTFGPLPGISAFHDSLGYYPGLLYNEETGGLYYWDRPASMVVPATGGYTTRITWADRSPLTDLYGVDLGGGLVLGSGNPGDDGVQYGLHIAIVNNARNGTYAKVLTWNSPALLDMDMTASTKVKNKATYVTYKINVTNTTPMSQKAKLTMPIPENTTLVKAPNGYVVEDGMLVFEGTLWKGAALSGSVMFKINPETPKGTVISAIAVLEDDALGDVATLDITY